MEPYPSYMAAHMAQQLTTLATSHPPSHGLYKPPPFSTPRHWIHSYRKAAQTHSLLAEIPCCPLEFLASKRRKEGELQTHLKPSIHRPPWFFRESPSRLEGRKQEEKKSSTLLGMEDLKLCWLEEGFQEQGNSRSWRPIQRRKKGSSSSLIGGGSSIHWFLQDQGEWLPSYVSIH